MSGPLTVSLRVAAEFMGVSRRHARRILNLRHQQNPQLGILLRPSGAPEGHIEVSASALRQLVLGGVDDDAEDLSQRVGLVESDIASLQIRLARIEIGIPKPRNEGVARALK